MLDKIKNFKQPQGSLVLCIMDGIGYGKYEWGDAVANAHTPNLDWLHTHCKHRPITAHGKLVGLPSDDDMGNSEVGHNAIGGGKVVSQGAKLVNNAINTRTLFDGGIWKKLINNAVGHKSTLHFIGLFSDGNIHSHINHLKAMIEQAKKRGVCKVRLHILLDGRDVGETTALDYVLPFEQYLEQLSDSNFDIKIASGGGRMTITMDRYNADWKMVEKGYNTHVYGKARQFSSAEQAIKTYRDELGCIDQNLPEFVIAKEGQAVGKIQDNDSVIFYNFRGDRSIEISQAFENDDFSAFDRGTRPKVEYAGMMEYDGDNHIPKQYLVAPPLINNPLSEYLCDATLRSYAISETQKFGHITFFFNGNRTEKFDDKLETYEEIASDLTPFEQRPWMKAAQITDLVIRQIEERKQDFIRLNYANGDMVGHTGDYIATRLACEVVDLQLGRLMKAVKKAGGLLIVTADHGNADDMFQRDEKGEVVYNERGKIKAKTSHSLGKVPFIIYDPHQFNEFNFKTDFEGGLGNISSTCLNLLGYKEPNNFSPSLIKLSE